MLRAQMNRNALGHTQHTSRFRFIPEELPWREHEANARRMGGYLATITSSRETKMFGLLQEETQSGLAACAMDKELVEAHTTGDGSTENGGST